MRTFWRDVVARRAAGRDSGTASAAGRDSGTASAAGRHSDARRAFGPDSDASWLLGRQSDARRPLSVRNPPEDGVCVRNPPEFRDETVVPGETVSGGDGRKLRPARWAYRVRSNGQSTGHPRLEPLNQLTKQQVSVYRYARVRVFKQFG